MAGLDQIRGQELAVQRLRAALRTGRVPHAYLFSGPPGVGKGQTARVLAQALVCLRGSEDACGRCAGCRKVVAGTHSDVVTVTAPEGKRRIVIKQVRTLQGQMAYRPYEARHRVVLISDADTMTEEAANALLKTLEEPPDSTLFVLTTAQPWNLLATIRSRCQEVRFIPLGRAEVATRMEAEGCSAELARVVAGLSEGSLGRARELVRAGIEEERSAVLVAVAELDLDDPVSLLALSESWYRERERVHDRIDLLLSWYRDLLVLASGGASDALIHLDLLNGPLASQRRLGRAAVLRCLDLLLEARAAIKERNANVRLTAERLFIGLAEQARGARPATPGRQRPEPRR